MKIVCASAECRFASEEEDTSNVIFISFPNDDTAKIWARNCGRADLLAKPNEELHSDHYVCSRHIEDRYFISKTDPIIIARGAIPTLFPEDPMRLLADPVIRKDSKFPKRAAWNESIRRADGSPDEYKNTEIDSDFKNTVDNHEPQTRKDSTMDVFGRENETEMPDNDTLTYCVINAEIDQYDGMTMGFSTLCRICGEEAPEGIEIFGDKGIELGLKEKIGLHMPIAVRMDDIMPQRLCIECYDKLESTHSLITVCLQTDIRFRRFLNIGDTPEYESRFQTLLDQFSTDMAEDICGNETVRHESMSFTCNKYEEIQAPGKTSEYKLEKDSGNMVSETSASMELGSLEATAKNQVNSDLNDLLKVLKGEDDEDNRNRPNGEMKEMTEPETGESASESGKGGILCTICKDTFRTPEIFEDHKILCDDNDSLDLNDSKGPQAVESISFQFNMKTCSTCKEVFETASLFDEHKDSCSKPSTQLSCQSCEQQFFSTEELELHEQLHIQLGEVAAPNRKCGYCLAAFYTRKELQNHISESHGGQTLFKCSTCDKAYAKWSSLDVHEATHRSDNPFLCDLCGKSFKHSNNLRGHKRTHLDDSEKKRHVCELCGNAFRSRFHLSEHMNQHNGNKPYACEQCGKAFYKRIQLRQHKLSHGSNRYACPICAVTFNRRGNMNMHLKRHQNREDALYNCSVCNYKSKSMSELKQHRKQHSEKEIVESVKRKAPNGTWECGICSRVFTKRLLWVNHERSHNGDKTSVDCDECGKKLSSKSSLAYHKKSMHSTERPHMCQFCGGSFVSKESRLIHERIHTGERPYVCQICNMQYRCSSNLCQHMKSHLENRPHVCRYCNKGFTRKGALCVHERIHTGVKPFACAVCGRQFAQKNDMMKHTKTHRVKSMQCEQCNEVFSTKKEILKHMSLHEENPSESQMIQGFVVLPQQLETYTINIPYTSIEESGELRIVQND